MQDLPFRILIAAVMLAAMSISGYYRRRANRLDRKIAMQEGRLALALIRLVALAYLAGLLTYLIHPAWMDWARLPVPEPLRWLAAAGMAASIPLLFWLFSNLGKNVTPTIQVREQANLVTSGPYRWVRHPLYSIATLQIFLLSLAASNAFFMATALMALLFLAWRAPQEEARLIERFGDEYREYMRRTGRFVPKRAREGVRD